MTPKPPRKARRKVQAHKWWAAILKRSNKVWAIDDRRERVIYQMQQWAWDRSDYRIARVSVKELP